LIRRPARAPVRISFTLKHGSWLNLVKCFFSKLARSVLRRVASKQQLKYRLIAAVETATRRLHTHKLEPPNDSNFKIAGLESAKNVALHFRESAPSYNENQ
jgi:hypothetical protein